MQPAQKDKQQRFYRQAPVVIGIVAIVVGITTYYFSRSWLQSIIFLIATFAAGYVYLYARKKLQESARIHMIESVFPDFLQLMASNLRAGMTIDRALLLSARKEFAPLDEELVRLGKDLVTGKEIERALTALALRVNSEKITKTISLINSGIKSGGNLSILLEETAINMRERSFVEKRAASNVLMYVIFIFFAVAVGAPVLFALSSVLVQVLTSLLSTIPEVSTQGFNLPFTLTKISLPVSFILYYSIFFLLTMAVLGSFVLGLVNKGEEKAGLKYTLPIAGLAIAIFFIARVALINQFGSLFG